MAGLLPNHDGYNYPRPNGGEDQLSLPIPQPQINVRTVEVKVPKPYPVEKLVYKDRQVPVPTPVEKIVEKVVYKNREVPQVRNTQHFFGFFFLLQNCIFYDFILNLIYSHTQSKLSEKSKYQLKISLRKSSKMYNIGMFQYQHQLRRSSRK